VRRLLALLFGSLMLAALLPTAHVAAGGWAVTTLDEMPPAVRAGEVVPVGFVIRQHGVTPVAPDGDIGLEVHSPSGKVAYFAATPSGAVGHYVADVVFPERGTARWTAHQGWFAPQDLGIVDVGSGTSTLSADMTTHGWPSVIRLVVPLLALLAAAVAAGDAIRSRRRVAT